MAINIIPSGDALGARIEGVDLTRPLDDATFDAVRDAFYKHEVVYFRGQALDDADHIRFSERFGELRKLKLDQLHAKHPEIFVVSNIMEDGKHIGAYDAGIFWHTDGAYLANPHAISALRALEVPVQEDGKVLGDTVFSSMSASYDALSESLKKRLEGLKALQSIMYRHQKTLDAGRKKEYNAAVKADPEAIHPVVRVHPVNGRKCLYVSEGYTVKIVGLPEDESRDLIREITSHCAKPEFHYRHNWQQGDLVMWDDCSTQHKATFDYALPLRRRMHRTTVVNGL